MMFRGMPGVPLLLVLLTAGGFAVEGGAASPGLTVQDGRLMKDGQPFRGVGANYYDLFLRVLRDRADESTLRGLARLSRAGIPFVRFAGPFSAREWNQFFEHQEEYFLRMDRVVRAAEKENVGLIPSMFWTLNLCETVGETRDQWGAPESKTLDRMRRYVAAVVNRYARSPAIWAWEFGNELNLKADLPNAARFRPPGGTARDDVKSQHVVMALREFAAEVRRRDSWRPIFSGNSHPRSCAWHNSFENSWKADSREQFRQMVLRDNPEPLDTIGVHLYADNGAQKELGTWATNFVQWQTELKRIATEAGRPVFIGEFGLASKGDERATRAAFEGLLAGMEECGIDLAAFWVYDNPRQEGSWNVTADNKRGYMIEVSAEANRRWLARARSRANQ
ncbi:MAG: cellulase family glycosylhydrolase [Verrucomicrobiota bacterium]